MKEVLPISGAFLVLTAIFQTSSANPAGGNVTVGSATITQDGDILSVVTGSTKTVIDWDSFSIGTNQLTQILQPGANAATLNRVVGTMPSELLGTLVSNGKVALINENGILVGNTGIIDTHGFIGSTLNTSNEAFVGNGSLMFSGASEASILNQGAILAREGDVFLLGRNVANAGSIEAHNGNAGLAAGGEIVLRKASDEHVYVEVKSSSRGDKVVNSGTIKAIQDDLHHNGGNPYQYAMNTGGTGVNNIQIRPGGGVYLNAGTEGNVVHSGAIKAVKGDKGGDVALSGRTVDVKSGSTIDASGAKAGGTVKIGGGLHGKDASIANSKVTRVQKGATIKADATENGKGGEVVIWSDGATSYQGSISAKGAGSGAGGSAEVSGKEHLDFRGDVDLTAASGKKGDLLLDPANITIQASNPDIAGDGTNNDIATAADLDSATLDFPAANSVITAGQVGNLLLLSNLTLAATNDINVDAAISTLGLFSLTLDAGHDINVNAAINIPGALTLTAGNDISVSGALSLVGPLSATAGNDITISGAVSSAGAVTFVADHNVSLNAIVQSVTGNVVVDFGQAGLGGALSLGAGGAIDTPLGTATATGGAGDDTVAFTSTPASAVSVDLAGGTNTVKLTAGDDQVTLTGANAIGFGTATIAGVTHVDGLGGTNDLVLTASDDTFTATAANTGNAGGIAFSSISSVDGNGGTDSFVNSTGSAFDGATISVAGITATDFDTIDTAALNLTAGSDAFTVTGANAGIFNGQAYGGVISLDGLGGSDTLTNSSASAFAAATLSVAGITESNFETVNTAALTLTTGDDAFTLSTPGSATFAGIAYTGLTGVDGLAGINTFTNGTAEAFSAQTMSAGGVTASNFSTVVSSLLTLTTGDDNFTVVSATDNSLGGITYRGVTQVDGLGGTDTVTLTGGNDVFTVTGSGTGSLGSISFSTIEAVAGNGGVDRLVNNTSATYDAAANSVSGIAQTGFSTITTATVDLTAGDDVFQVTGLNTASFGGLNFTGLSTVNTLGGSNKVELTGDDTFLSVFSLNHGFSQGIQIYGINEVVGLGTGFNGDRLLNFTGDPFNAATRTVGGIKATGIETIQTYSLLLTPGDDTFTMTASTKGTFDGLNYEGLLGTIDGGGGNNKLLNLSGLYFMAGPRTINSAVFNNFGTVQTEGLALTAGADIFTVTGNGVGTHDGVTYLNYGGTPMSLLGQDGTDLLVNNSGLVFSAATKTVAGFKVADFETINTPLLSLTTGNDNFTLSGAGTAGFGGLNYTGLTQVDGLSGSDTFINGTGVAFEGGTLSVAGVTEAGFETVNTSLLNLTSGDDLFTVTGSGAGSFAGQSYTGLTQVDAKIGTDLYVNNSGSAFNGGTNSAGGVKAVNFDSVQTAALSLSAGADLFTVTGTNSGALGAQSFSGLASVDGLGGNDTLVNGTALAFDGATNSVAGITGTNFETVSTALLTLTAGDDLFTVTGLNAGAFGSLNFTNLTQVDGLAGSNTLVNGTALAFEASTLSVNGVTEANFQTVSTALLNLTGGDDSFALTGAGAGTFAGLSYTGLTSVDALGGNDIFVNNSGTVYSAGTNSAAGVTAVGFETVNTALLALTAGADTFTVTGANSGTYLATNFTGVTNVDGLGGGDLLVNGTALAYDGAANSVSGITQTNFETVSTALLNLTTGNDVFTVTGASTGTFGTLNFTNLTLVDGLAGSDTLVNGTALAFEASTLSVSGVTEAGFETVNTALLNLTTGDDSFALTGAGTGSFAGLNYTGLTAVDGLAGVNTTVLTGGNDSFTVTGTRAGTGSTVAFTNLDQVDGAGSSDTLVNGTALAFEGSTNSVAGVTQTNFEIIDTAKLNLTTGDDLLTVTGPNTGTFGALTFINLTQVDGLAGSDTLVNSTVGAFDGATNTVAGITELNFETVSTALLTLTGGNDLFTVTGGGTGTFGALNFTNLTQVDALGGTDTIALTAGNDSLTVTGTGAATTSGIALSNIENVDGSTGTNSIVLTSGDDIFTVTGSRAGNGLGIAFTNIDSVEGAGGTNTFMGTAVADSWSITGINAGSLMGVGFNQFSQLRSGGTGVDVFDFASGGDITGFISGADAGGLNLAALAFTTTGVATNLTGSIRAAGLRLGSMAGGSFTLLNAGNNVGTLAAHLDGSLSFTNSLGYTVGTVDGTTGISTTGDAIVLNSGTGPITLASDVTTGSTTAGDIVFSKDVALISNAAITGGSAQFDGAVDGGFGLTVNSSGATTFSGAVGSNAALASLATDSGGNTAINGGGVTASGAQVYGDTVTLGAPVSVFTGSAVTFAATLDGASATTVNAVTTLFSGAVGGSTALTSLTTDAAGVTTVGGLVSTTGPQVYSDAVTLGSATSVFNGAAVTFGSTLDGASDTTVNATTTTFGGAVGGATALTSLTTDAAGSTLIKGPGVSTTGTQSYGDDVVLNGPTTLFTGAGVNFDAKLDGSSAVVVNAIDTRFGGAVGSGTALVSLTTDAPGTTQIDGGSVITTGAQTYTDEVALGADTTLKGGSLDFKSIAAQLHTLALDSAGAISLGDVLNATKLNLKAVGNILQKTDSKIVVGELSGDTHGRTILFNDGNQIVTIGNFTAGGDLLIFDNGTSGGGAVYGMNVTGDIMGHGSVWLVEGSGGLKVDPTGSVTVDGVGNALLLVGGLDLALGIPGSGELVLKGKIDLTGGARGFLVMNSIGVNGFGGSDLSGAKNLIKSLNFSFDPSLPTVFGAALRDQADVGPLDYNMLANVIASKLPNPMLGPLTAAVFQSPKPDTDSASQISDIVALVRGFFNDLDTGDEKVTNDASAIVEIGKLARFESGVYPPAYGPFALTSYEYEWWLQEKDGKVKDKDLFYNKRYPLYLKQKGSGPNGRPNYESILEDR